MNGLGEKIARKRKDLGYTQAEFAEMLSVTRQTVSRWEAGTVLPDIDKISDIAEKLDVSCDYLLKDDIKDESADGAAPSRTGRLLASAKGKTVKLTFYEDEIDADLYDEPCEIVDFEGNWMKIVANTKKGRIEKLIPVSSVLTLKFEQK